MCDRCGKGFPTVTELLRHTHLHDEREEFECTQCGAVYYKSASLNVHVTGKHGAGYV